MVDEDWESGIEKIANRWEKVGRKEIRDGFLYGGEMI